jgi:hypothetical protein
MLQYNFLLRPPFFPSTSYRSNALGQFSPLLSPNPLYLAFGAADNARRVAYPQFVGPISIRTTSDLRLALIP